MTAMRSNSPFVLLMSKAFTQLLAYYQRDIVLFAHYSTTILQLCRKLAARDDEDHLKIEANNLYRAALLPHLWQGYIFFCLEIKFCSMGIRPSHPLHSPTVCFNVDHIPNLQKSAHSTSRKLQERFLKVINRQSTSILWHLHPLH